MRRPGQAWKDHESPYREKAGLRWLLGRPTAHVGLSGIILGLFDYLLSAAWFTWTMPDLLRRQVCGGVSRLPPYEARPCGLRGRCPLSDDIGPGAAPGRRVGGLHRYPAPVPRRVIRSSLAPSNLTARTSASFVI